MIFLFETLPFVENMFHLSVDVILLTQCFQNAFRLNVSSDGLRTAHIRDDAAVHAGKCLRDRDELLMT